MYLGFWSEGDTPGHAKGVEAVCKMKDCSQDTKQVNRLGYYTRFRITKSAGKMLKMGSPGPGYPRPKLGVPNMCENEKEYADAADSLQPIQQV